MWERIGKLLLLGLRDGKTYEGASNACVNLFLARVKSVPNFTVFCWESEEYFLAIYYYLWRVMLLFWSFSMSAGTARDASAFLN